MTNIRISAHFTHLRKFRNFVFATEVTIFSDHNPLVYLRECAPKSAKLTRWALGLQEFMHADSSIFHTFVGYCDVTCQSPRSPGQRGDQDIANERRAAGKGLLQLRFEHDTSTTRYNTPRDFSCARMRDRFEHSTKISGRRVLHVD